MGPNLVLIVRSASSLISDLSRTSRALGVGLGVTSTSLSLGGFREVVGVFGCLGQRPESESVGE